MGKKGEGLLILEPSNFDGNEFVIGVSSPSNYPYGHTLFGEDNNVHFSSGYRGVINTHISQSSGFIVYKTPEQRDERLLQAKEELEYFGYEVGLRKMGIVR